MLQSLPNPDFSKCNSLQELLVAVGSEMHQTNFLESFEVRFERTSLIIELWNECSLEITNTLINEAKEQWNT